MTIDLMIMRMDVSRPVDTGMDSHGSPIVRLTPLHEDLPCFVWAADRSLGEGLQYPGKEIIVVTEYRAFVPRRADIRENDETSAVRDRTGETLFGSRYRVMHVIPREDHKQVRLEEIKQ